MIESIDFKAFNIPDSVRDKLIKDFAGKNIEFLTIKSTITSTLTADILNRYKKTMEILWSQNEVAFLQHGTTKDDATRFSKELFITIFAGIYRDLIENVKEDLSEPDDNSVPK